MKDIYRIVALPDEHDAKILNDIQHYLYINGFRYTNKPSASDIHITLTQTRLDQEDVQHLYQEIDSISKKFPSFLLSCEDLVNKQHTWISNDPELSIKYPQGAHWIALFFKHSPLKLLAEALLTIQQTIGLDDTDNYANRIRNIKPIALQTTSIIDHIADHMNICNYTRPDKAEEAIVYIKDRLPKEIKITKIGLRDYHKNIVWERNLYG